MSIYEESVNYMFSNYEAIASFATGDLSEKVVLSTPERICRFCKLSPPETSFRKEAHAIPHLLGNERIFSTYECDACNAKISSLLEDSLAKYLGLWRTLMQVKGKTGVVSYKSPDKKNRIDFESEGLKIQSFIDNPIFTEDEENNSLTIKGIRQPYTPIAVYKCLVKIAMSVLPEEYVHEFSETISWLLEDDHVSSRFDIQGLMCISAFIPGPNPFGKPKVILYKRKTNESPAPFMQMTLTFSNLFFQICIPCKKRDMILDGKTINIMQLPHDYMIRSPFGKVIVDTPDFSTRSLVRNEPVEMTMGYNTKELSPNI